MAEKILPFPVPESIELATFLEEHIAAPSAGSRLLTVRGPREPYELSGIERGVFIWDHFDSHSASTEGFAIELRYEISLTTRPRWYSEKPPCATELWFTMLLFRPEGTLLAEVPLRQYFFDRRPQEFCLNCHAETDNYIDELTGEGCCYNCAPDLWPGMREAMERGSWFHIKSSRTILDCREKPASRVQRGHYSLKGISLSFFERHPTLLSTFPRAYKVYNRRINRAALGYFVADPRQMPIRESADVKVYEP